MSSSSCTKNTDQISTRIAPNTLAFSVHLTQRRVLGFLRDFHDDMLAESSDLVRVLKALCAKHEIAVFAERSSKLLFAALAVNRGCCQGR